MLLAGIRPIYRPVCSLIPVCIETPLLSSFCGRHAWAGQLATQKIAQFRRAPSHRDCLTPHPSISAVFQDVGRRPDVVFHDGSRCVMLSMNGDYLRVAQLISAVGLTRDRSGRPLPACCHRRGEHLESISRTSNSRNSSINRVTHTGNRSETGHGTSGYEPTRWNTVKNQRRF